MPSNFATTKCKSGQQHVSGLLPARSSKSLAPDLSAESAARCGFFASIKGELLDLQPWPTRAMARRATVEYNGWYNGTRLHSAPSATVAPTNSRPQPLRRSSKRWPDRAISPVLKAGQPTQARARAGPGAVRWGAGVGGRPGRHRWWHARRPARDLNNREWGLSARAFRWISAIE
jgi:hypothetical protein